MPNGKIPPKPEYQQLTQLIWEMLKQGKSHKQILNAVIATPSSYSRAGLKTLIKRTKEKYKADINPVPAVGQIYEKPTNLQEDEQAVLESYRKQKSLLEKECLTAGINITDVKHYWYKSKLFSVFAKTPQKTIEDLKAEMIADMNNHSPDYPKIVRKRLNDPICLVLDPADIHIGKLASKFETGEQYNSNLAVKRVHDGVEELLRITSMFNIEQIVLIIGNDILHTDTPKATTTSGTSQDTDGMWYDNFLIAKQLYVDIIEKLMVIADVHILHNVSNHDYMSGWYLSEVIKSWFRKSANITFDNSMRHRKAYKYYDNLIGTTHGDGAKETDLPLLMATEFPLEWSETKFRYIYTHHVHHKKAKDYIGITVESSRSPSATDGWHHRNGYQHSKQAIECYVHAKGKGQFGRFTHIF